MMCFRSNPSIYTLSDACLSQLILLEAMCPPFFLVYAAHQELSETFHTSDESMKIILWNFPFEDPNLHCIQKVHRYSEAPVPMVNFVHFREVFFSGCSLFIKRLMLLLSSED